MNWRVRLVAQMTGSQSARLFSAGLSRSTAAVGQRKWFSCSVIWQHGLMA